MFSVKYDLTKLSEFNDFDSNKAVNNFDSEQDYFDKLTHFTETWHDYLRLYNPIVVVFSDEARESFLTEMKVVESIAKQLEMAGIITKLNDLEEAINEKSDKSLSDSLKVFFAALEIVSNHIVSARLQDSTGSPLSADSASDETNVSTEKPLILAVDDSSVVLTVITNTLESDYKVIAVTSGKEAIRVIDKHTPDFFLLDIEMPIMNGFELAKIIKNEDKFKDAPILFLTSQAIRDYVIAAKELGVTGYMLKPIEKNVLLEKIDGYFNKK